MKVKKEIWEEVCDFCGNKKARICCVCGKDICNEHSLTLMREYTNEESNKMGGLMWVGSKTVLGPFCPDHIQTAHELRKAYNDSLSETKIKEGE